MISMMHILNLYNSDYEKARASRAEPRGVEEGQLASSNLSVTHALKEGIETL